MQKGFPKLSIIALITIVIMAIYSYIIPKFDYANLFTNASDSLLVTSADENVSSDSLYSQVQKPKKKPAKKKYVKKIKPVAFSEVVGGDDFSSLTPFFGKLDKYSQQRIKKLRIAYFGDSVTESDLGTNRLRRVWQDSLGGEGVGFIPAVSNLSQFRASIKHTYSDNWQEYSISRTSNRKMPLGLYGNVSVPFIIDYDSLVTYSSKSDSLSSDSLKVENPASWHHYSMMEGNWLAKPTLILLNQKSPLTIEYAVNRDTLTKEIKVSDKLQFIPLSDSLIKFLSITYYPQDTCFVYGVDFSDDEGIYIDNYSIRGNKGNNFIHLHEDILSQLFDYFKYDLTILHYGANVTDPIMKDYSWYRISMKNSIRYLKTIDYTQPMILFSVGDRGALADTLWVSSPDLPYLLKEQMRIAKDTKIGFYNLFTALGGENSNVILHDNKLLTSDHTHFTRKGAKYFGDLLYKKFSAEYAKYLEKK
jgi:lysophospholipase L1-like esterase